MMDEWTDDDFYERVKEAVKDMTHRLEIGCVYKRRREAVASINASGKRIYTEQPVESMSEYEARKRTWTLHLMRFLDYSQNVLEELEKERARERLISRGLH